MLPTLWIIGDSTVRTTTEGQEGWGDEIGLYFDGSKIKIKNSAVGGRSSRTFLTEGRWDEILSQLKSGDFVMMQFGHNDASPINEEPPVNKDTRSRGTIQNNSEETVDIINVLTEKPETVHSYGWYLRNYVSTAKSKGAETIICSSVPRKKWVDDKAVVRINDTWGFWARQAADASGALFIDLNEVICCEYQRLGKEKVEELFADYEVHTTPRGAKINAKAVISALNSLADNPLKFGLSEAGVSVPAFPGSLA